MLISDSHKFIFHHTPKTAGSSMTAALAPFLRHPVEFKGEDFGWQPKHHYPRHPMHWPAGECAPIPGYDEVAFVRNPFALVHSIWQKLHKAGFRGEQRIAPFFRQKVSFQEFVERTMAPDGWQAFGKPIVHLRWTQSEYLRVPDDRLVRVWKYESLPSSWKYMCHFLKIDPVPELPKLNAGGKGGRCYESCYTHSAIRLVADRYAEDLERWDYSW